MQLPEPLLIGTRREYDIAYLIDAAPKDKTVPAERLLLSLVLPPWQRDEVWTTDMKRRYIEGIFLGLGTGMYVVNSADYFVDGRTKPMSGWLLDGQQRISAIRDFLADELTIFDGIRFSMLDRVTALRRFLRTPFPCFEISYCDNEDTLLELYDRLRFCGVPHEAKPVINTKPNR